MDLIQTAKTYLASNAAESGADVLIGDLVEEVERLRSVLTEANNRWRHDFLQEVEDAADKLFRRLSANATDPFARKTSQSSALPSSEGKS